MAVQSWGGMLAVITDAFLWSVLRGSLSADCFLSWAIKVDGVQYEPDIPAARINHWRTGRDGRAVACRSGNQARQGQFRNQLGGRGRAWRLFPGGCGRHLQELRARCHYRAGRTECE